MVHSLLAHLPGPWLSTFLTMFIIVQVLQPRTCENIRFTFFPTRLALWVVALQGAGALQLIKVDDRLLLFLPSSSGSTRIGADVTAKTGTHSLAGAEL